MLSTLQLLAALGLLINFVEASQDHAIRNAHSPAHDSATSRSTTCTSGQVDPSSVYYSDTTIETTSTIQAPHPMNSSTTLTTKCFNETVTTTVIVSIISTDWSSTTETSWFTNTTTETTRDTITQTTTIWIPTTIMVAPNPCPTTCSMSAGTVNLFYWPTDHPERIYPSTYVNSHLNYTFTSPSVYMVIDTLYGYNTAGRAGPSGTSLVFPLDLDQVSTIDLTNSATRQLTLNDLGTDCPQTEAPSVIATAKPNGRCDPILLAPEPVKSWASPCNACGQFGLFDPPYAVSPLTGGLVTMTTTFATIQPQTIPSATSVDNTATPAETSTVVVSTSTDNTAMPVETSTTVQSTEATPSTADSSSTVMPIPVSSSTSSVTASSVSSSSVSSPATTSTFNPASKSYSPGGWLGFVFFVMAFML